MKIGIIVAMDKELQQLQSLRKENIVVQKCGIGKVNAALGAAEMIRSHRPDVIISSGCAGGNGDDINIQDIVVSTELAYHDVWCGEAVGSSAYGQVQGLPARFQADQMLLTKAREIAGPSLSAESIAVTCGATESQHTESLPTIHAGLIVTGDWFVDSKEKMREIIGHFPEAKAVDMESAAIAQTCYIYKVPFISFRVISDIPLRDTNASQYHDFWNNVADQSFHVTKAFIESL